MEKVHLVVPPVLLAVVRSLFALGGAILLALTAMHFLLLSLGLSITAGDMTVRGADDYRPDINHQIVVAMLAIIVIQVLLARILTCLPCMKWKGFHPLLRFFVAFIIGIAFTVLLTSIAVLTGGGLVMPSWEDSLNKMISG